MAYFARESLSSLAKYHDDYPYTFYPPPYEKDKILKNFKKMILKIL
jgi:hypothetical protein